MAIYEINNVQKFYQEEDSIRNQLSNPRIPIGLKGGSSRIGISESLAKAIRSRIQAIRKGQSLNVPILKNSRKSLFKK